MHQLVCSRRGVNMIITNIITTASLNATLDLYRIARENPNVVYRPQRFTAATWRHKDINGTFTLFPNGRVTHLGKPDGAPPEVHIHRYVSILKDQGHPVRVSSVRTVCMSASYRLSGKIDLYSVARLPGGSYEPEIFNASLIKRDQLALSVFHTGSVVIAGIKDIDDVYPILLELELLTK